jgi:hypothetical protein
MKRKTNKQSRNNKKQVFNHFNKYHGESELFKHNYDYTQVARDVLSGGKFVLGGEYNEEV